MKEATIGDALQWAVDNKELLGLGGFTAAAGRWAYKRSQARMRKLAQIWRVGVDDVERLRSEFGVDPAITLRRLFDEHAFRERETDVRLSLLEAHMGRGMYWCDAAGRCTQVNHALCELFGMDSSDMLGHGWAMAIEDRERAVQVWHGAIEKRLPYKASYYITNQRTGERFLAQTRAVPIIDGVPDAGYIGYVERSGPRRSTDFLPTERV